MKNTKTIYWNVFSTSSLSSHNTFYIFLFSFSFTKITFNYFFMSSKSNWNVIHSIYIFENFTVCFTSMILAKLNVKIQNKAWNIWLLNWYGIKDFICISRLSKKRCISRGKQVKKVFETLRKNPQKYPRKDPNISKKIPKSHKSSTKFSNMFAPRYTLSWKEIV